MQDSDTVVPPDARQLSRRRMFAGAGAVAAIPLLGAAPAAAAPARPASRTATPTVTVVADRAGVRLGTSEVPAGAVRFDITTAETTSPSVGLIQLRPGVSIDAFLHHYRLASSPDPVTRAKAVAMIDAEARYLGGAAVAAAVPAGWTAVLTPGTYHVLNYLASGSPDFRAGVRSLKVTATATPAPPPAVDGVIASYDVGYDGRFVVPPVLPATASFQVVNQTGQLNEAVFFGLVPGATAADVAAFFAAFTGGGPVPPSPFAGGPWGSAPLSPGGSGIVHQSLAPGNYIVTSFISNRRTSVKRAFEGMWSFVTVA